MTGSSGTPSIGVPQAVTPSPGAFLEAKLHRPPPRDSWVRRDRLVHALDRAVRHPVTLVAAPAGYGKTTLLAQWLDAADRPPTAWVSLDGGDNDPDRLWAHVAAALERAGCVVPADSSSTVAAKTDAVTSGTLLPALVNALG